MTFREQAERIVFEARNLSPEDATNLIEIRVKSIFLDGELAGIAAAQQSISRIGQSEAA